jgi:tRNA(Arg) A34 adenosine deaminase TadA
MLDTAIAVARANPVIGLPRMGAVIARRNKVISIGLNSHKTDPLQLRYSRHPLSICKHAEIAAIKNALKADRNVDLTKASIFIARVLKNGSTAMAQPCEGCQKALKAYGINRVFWTTDT